MDPTLARKALATVRLVNGTLGLLAPQLLLRRLGTDPDIDRSGYYPFRMFGIRTLVIGVELLVLKGDQRRRAVRLAVLIHASDTVSAALAGIRGDLARKPAAVTTAISATNTALAIIATRE
ncbi:hypothetical protein ACPPVT_16135 [Angustibacter sp. McL0619]|uniref:hypothetical protein n=1 Tax=Angustibacter sp. McL0619 TaxID=3415676 RepID=UPI003CF1BD20